MEQSRRATKWTHLLPLVVAATCVLSGWWPAADGDQAVALLRSEKIDPDSPQHSVIRTVHGVGYKYEPE